MKKVSLILDGIIAFLGSLILSFCIFRIINTPKIIAIITSLILSVCIFLAFILKQREKSLVASNTFWQNKRIFALKLKLSLMKNDEIIGLFASFLKNASKKDFYLENENYIYLFRFLPDELSASDALSLIKKVDYSSKQIVLFSNAFSKNLINLSATLKISLVPTEKIYSYLKEASPEFLEKLEILSPKKFSLSGIFLKKNAVRFILYGLILELLSLITFFPVFYVISGAVFIIYGLITLFFGNTVKQPTIDLDDILKEKPKSV